MNKQLTIIAELAQGFEGNFMQAKLLVKAAAAAGADAAKLQLVYADELATPDYAYYDLFRSLEMTDQQWGDLATYAKTLGIELQLDIFGSRSLALCESIGIQTIKLHGTDIANVGLLRAVAASAIQNVLLGAGGAHLSEIKTALDLLPGKQVTVMLGFQGYPTDDADNHVSRIVVIKQLLDSQFKNAKIGFADHAEPTSATHLTIPVMAIGAGATVIEKHLTLAKVMKLEDHEAALNPDEFALFVQGMRTATSAWGSAETSDDFGMSGSEKKYRETIRRHVVAARDIAAGETISPTDLILKRTSATQVIKALGDVYGKTTLRPIKANTAIVPTDIQS